MCIVCSKCWQITSLQSFHHFLSIQKYKIKKHLTSDFFQVDFNLVFMFIITV